LPRRGATVAAIHPNTGGKLRNNSITAPVKTAAVTIDGDEATEFRQEKPHNQ